MSDQSGASAMQSSRTTTVSSDTKQPVISQPRQRHVQLQVQFSVPEADLDGLTPWLEALGVGLVSSAILPAAAASPPESRARCWLGAALGLAQTLLQAANLPSFAEPDVLLCREAAAPGLWRGTVSLPALDLLPREVHDIALAGAFKAMAWMLVHSLTADNRERVFEDLTHSVLVPLRKRAPRGKSSLQILWAAFRRGIPFRHIGSGVYLVGWGARARRIERSIIGGDTAIGILLTSNKAITANMLREAGLPVPTHERVNSLDGAATAAARIGYPVVIKPVDAERGEGVSVDVVAEDLAAAFEKAQRASPRGQVLVERQVAGVCHRVLVANGRLLYAVKRLPVGVYGDGVSSVASLVGQENRQELAKPLWARASLFPLDDEARQSLKAAGFRDDSVPATGVFAPLRRIESTADGGVDEDFTTLIHPENLRVALLAASLCGLEVAGVDFISTDLSLPWYQNGAVINEVNIAPLLGGGEISRSCLPSFLEGLLDGDGRIPVEVFVGDEQAWRAAEQRVKRWQAQGLAACLTSHARTLDRGAEVPMALQGLGERVRAVVSWPQVEALAVVVQTDEFSGGELPLEGVDVVHCINSNIASLDPARREERVKRVLQAVSGWQWPRG